MLVLKAMEKHYASPVLFFSFAAEPQTVVLALVSLAVAIHEITMGGEFSSSDSVLGAVNTACLIS